MVGPVGFEPTTSAESLVYGYLHALPNFFIPKPRSILSIDSGARRHSSLGPDLRSGLARLRPRFARRLRSAPPKGVVAEIIGINFSRKEPMSCLVFFLLCDVGSRFGHIPSSGLSETMPKVVEGREVA